MNHPDLGTMFQWKETHLRYDGEVFAEEGERADSLYAWGP